jgi:flagellar FliJ protein
VAKFVFKLQGVLRQRELIEHQRQREMAELQRQMTILEQALRDLNGSIQTSSDDLRANHLTGKLDMNFLAAHRRYQVAMQRQGMELAQRMALLQRQMDESRQQLAEAAKQRKVIEKLREKQLERWKADQAMRELAAMDEVARQVRAYPNNA